MSSFKPLDAQRAIRDDAELQRADKALLWTAVLRTDNNTRKVRASLAMLAQDAGYRPNVATRVFAESNLPVMRYFEKIERKARVVNLWFHPTARLSIEVTHSESESPSAGVRLSIGVTSTVDEGDPSALSASSAYKFSRPSSLQDDSDEIPAAVEVDGPLPCGCFPPGMSCPVCRGDTPVRSKHSPDKQKQIHDDHLKRDEKLGTDGTPIDQDRPSSGYQSRRRL